MGKLFVGCTVGRRIRGTDVCSSLRASTVGSWPFWFPQEDSIWRPFILLLLWAVQAYYWFQLLTLGRDGGHPFGIAPVVLEAFGASLVCWIVAGILAATAPKAIEEEKSEASKTHIDVSLR